MYELLFSSHQPLAKDFRKHCCNAMFPHIRQQLTNIMVDDLTRDHQLPITERDNQIQTIQYEKVGLQGEIRAKDQQIAALQRRCVGYLAKEDNNNGITIIAKNNEAAEHPYIFICGQHSYRRHVIKVALYSRMDIPQMPLLHITSCESID